MEAKQTDNNNALTNNNSSHSRHATKAPAAQQQEQQDTPSSPAHALFNKTESSKNNKKRQLDQISWECAENIPRMLTFSRYKPKLLPHQMIATAYTVLINASIENGQNKLLSPSSYETLRLLLQPVIDNQVQEETTEKNEQDTTTPNSRSQIMQQELLQIPEVRRMQSFGFAVKPLIDLPLSFDWSSLGLGTTTGSAAFNQRLLQIAALHCNDALVPQLSSTEYYTALREFIQNILSNIPDDQLVEEIDPQLLQVDHSTHTKSAAQIQELLCNFHTRAAVLRERWSHYLEDSDEIGKTTSSTAEPEFLLEPKRIPSNTSSHWTTAVPSLLIQQGYDDPRAFCSPNDTLY